jgi:hypothetical protein
LRAYEGFSLDKWQGQAVYVGPTLFAKLSEKAWLSLSWNVQVAGSEAIDRAARAEAIGEYFEEAAASALEAGDPLPPPPQLGRLHRHDLTNFERHQIRIKAGFEF